MLTAGGYPDAYATGDPIEGLASAGAPDTVTFHAGTRREGDRVVTAGGRVLTVTAQGPTVEEARRRAYAAVDGIRFRGVAYRRDIARTAPASHPTPGSAYAASGVDLGAGERAVDLMKAAVRRTYTADVLGGIGAFGGSISVQALAAAHDLVLVATTDGVGTKTMVAEAMGVYDTVGHDIVNHCVNDILVQGARPLLFLDYIASAKLDPVQIATVVGGCAAACEAVGCVLIGGETAEMPGVYQPGSFDLVGTMIGWVDRQALIDGSAVRPGDVCLGLRSSGLLPQRLLACPPRVGPPWGGTPSYPSWGNRWGALLAPHRPYLREVEALWDAGVSIRAMAHIQRAAASSATCRASSPRASAPGSAPLPGRCPHSSG